MTYYKMGTNGTLNLDWERGAWAFRGGRLIFRANEVIGKEFSPRAWETTRVGQGGAVSVGGIYRGSSCCGSRPSAGGTLQYRAYGCLPMNYTQLMKGHVITPGQRWSAVRSALRISPGHVGAYIAIIAFFIPTVADRNRGFRPTFSNPAGTYSKRVVLAPACTPSLWGPSNCSDGIQTAEEHYGIDRVRTPCFSNDNVFWFYNGFFG
jgi:hypothetical protein